MRALLWICLAFAPGTGLVGTGPVAAEPQPPADAPTIRLTPAAPPAAARELMRRWHRRTHARMSPVLEAWEVLALAAREHPGGRLLAGCRRLDLALGRLRLERLPIAPDPSVSLHLEETLRSLGEAAASCTQGAWFLTAWRLRQADDSWRELRGRLLLYGLTP